MKDALRIDVISDVMCPWCIIGYRQLVDALEATQTPHEVHWHPFELNPNMPAEGQNIREHVAEKYGATPEQSAKSRAQMTQIGAELGFEFTYNPDSRMHNTFNTHQLLHWAGTLGRKGELKMAMFTAHFTHGRNLSDNTVLADIADEAGFDRVEALAILEDQRYAQTVRQTEAFWVQQGISGVPAVVFDRKHLVTGAQGTPNFVRILEQLASAPSSKEAT